MTIFDILNKIDNMPADPRMIASRREAFRTMGSLGKKTALAAVPFGLTSLFSTEAKADGSKVLDVLNFALLLEYLESDFYIMGLDSGVIPGGSDAEKVYMQISKHEAAHVELLKMAIKGAGGEPIDKPAFDFTAGGNFDPFHNYEVFLILSQGFEDTGVRAYKGQAANLMEKDAVLETALQIHSVEARHASEVRRIRGLKGWITRDERGEGVPAAVQPVYDGEDQVMQAGLDVTTVTSVGVDGITEAFDEPLTKEEVTAIASLFLA